MKKSLLTILIIVLVASVAGLGVATYAWLTDTDNATATYTVGDVEYGITSNLPADTLIVPGQPLFTTDTFTLTNSSNVDSQIRVIVLCEVQDGANWYDVTLDVAQQGLGWTIGNESANDEIYTSEIATGWTREGNYYTYADDIAANGTAPVFCLNQLQLNGNLVGNTYSGKVLRFTVTFQAKQADYVTWNELAGFSFTSGLAA